MIALVQMGCCLFAIFNIPQHQNHAVCSNSKWSQTKGIVCLCSVIADDLVIKKTHQPLHYIACPPYSAPWMSVLNIWFNYSYQCTTLIFMPLIAGLSFIGLIATNADAIFIQFTARPIFIHSFALAVMRGKQLPLMGIWNIYLQCLKGIGFILHFTYNLFSHIEILFYFKLILLNFESGLWSCCNLG